MTQFRGGPSPVSTSPEPSLRRLGELVRSTVQQLFDSHVFQARLGIGHIAYGPRPDGAPLKLEWGKLNRVALVSTGTQVVQLPAIRPEWVGQPLIISKLTYTGIMRLIPGGSLVSNLAPLVNRSPTGMLVATGVKTAITDGTDWTVY